MKPLELAQGILAAGKELNSAVEESMPTMDLVEARELRKVCREARAWLWGVEKMVENG